MKLSFVHTLNTHVQNKNNVKQSLAFMMDSLLNLTACLQCPEKTHTQVKHQP